MRYHDPQGINYVQAVYDLVEALMYCKRPQWLERHISELDNAAVQGRVQLDGINSGDTDERCSQCCDKWTDYSGSSYN